MKKIFLLEDDVFEHMSGISATILKRQGAGDYTLSDWVRMFRVSQA
jgi:hypothetical protein